MLLWVALLSVMGCGDDSSDLQVRFQMQTIGCNQPGLSAYLQVTGVPGVCELNIGEDRTVSGRCAAVPTGAVRIFRLVYFFRMPGERPVNVDLARISVELDLRNETRTSIVLAFPADRLVTSMDDDDDGRSNLTEFCEGTDPTTRD
ncbi:MAG: hypothetical protein AAF449_05935 [Myxococcota bacterium]